MQTWVLTALLVLSLFLNGYLFAQRAAEPPVPPPPDAAQVSELQSLLLSLNAEPEWRHRFISLGRFVTVRNERRRAQQRILSGELFELLEQELPDPQEITSLIETMGFEDATHRLRMVEQLTLLVRDLEPGQRAALLQRLRAMELHLDELHLLERLLP